MEIIGYILSIFIGITLGLIGAGGSILMVPVLVYLFHIHPTLATSYSLFIIGLTSLMGIVLKTKDKCIDFLAVLYFGLPSVIIILIVRKIILQHIPEVLFSVNDITIKKSTVTMIIFALLMLGSAWSMIKDKHTEKNKNPDFKNQNLKLIICGIAVGLITGFLGAGGGFLIIPALIILLKMPIKIAVGTSLMIITINSLIGFLGDLDHISINWFFAIKILSMAIIGIFIGNSLQKRLASDKLKPIFGIFILVVGFCILIAEIF